MATGKPCRKPTNDSFHSITPITLSDHQQSARCAPPAITDPLDLIRLACPWPLHFDTPDTPCTETSNPARHHLRWRVIELSPCCAQCFHNLRLIGVYLAARLFFAFSGLQQTQTFMLFSECSFPAFAINMLVPPSRVGCLSGRSSKFNSGEKSIDYIALRRMCWRFRRLSSRFVFRTSSQITPQLPHLPPQCSACSGRCRAA